MIRELGTHRPCSTRSQESLQDCSPATCSFTWKPGSRCLLCSIRPICIGDDESRDRTLVQLGAPKKKAKKELNWIKQLIEKGA